MGISAIPTNYDTMVANEAGRHATPVSMPNGELAQTDSLYWGEDGFGFGDALDIVNPLQHLPVIGNMYREYTGDSIAPAAKIIGGMIFGGPIGLVLAIANAIFEEATGKELGSAVAELVTEDGDELPTQLSSAADIAAENGTAPDPEAGTATPQALALAIPPSATPAAAPGNPASLPAELPALPPAGAAGVPQLSPQAFDALMRSFNGPTPATATAAAAPPVAPKPAPVRAGVQAGPEAPGAGALPLLQPVLPPAGKPTPLLRAPKAAETTTGPAIDDRRQAALDLHQQLRSYAEQKGVAVGQAAK